MEFKFRVPMLVLRILGIISLLFMAASLVAMIVFMILHPVLIIAVGGTCLYFFVRVNDKAFKFMEDILNYN